MNVRNADRKIYLLKCYILGMLRPCTCRLYIGSKRIVKDSEAGVWVMHTKGRRIYACKLQLVHCLVQRALASKFCGSKSWIIAGKWSEVPPGPVVPVLLELAKPHCPNDVLHLYDHFNMHILSIICWDDASAVVQPNTFTSP